MHKSQNLKKGKTTPEDRRLKRRGGGEARRRGEGGEDCGRGWSGVGDGGGRERRE